MKTDGLKKKKTTNLPPHEYVVAAFQGVIVKVIRVEAFGIFVKRLKLTLKRNRRMKEGNVSFTDNKVCS